MNVWDSTATGGSSTTVVDTKIPFGDGWFDGGTVWALTVAHDSHTDRLQRISDWNHTTKTITFLTSITDGVLNHNVAAGDYYSAAPSDYPLYALIQAMNHAMRVIGPLPKVDTSLTTVENQQFYTLPDTVIKPVRVEIATETADPYDYQVNRHWEIAYTGAYRSIKFDDGHFPEPGHNIRITHHVEHTVISAATDIENSIPLDLVVRLSKPHALLWRINNIAGDEPHLVSLYNEAKESANQAMGDWGLPRVQEHIHYATW